MPGNAIINLQDDDDGDISSFKQSNELEEYLIQQKSQNNNNVFKGFLSKVKTYVPKRTGTGSIEDDIALRFGRLFGSSSNAPEPGTSSSFFSSTTENRKKICGINCELSRKERIIGFFVLLLLGLFFFALSSFYIPVLLFAARKFGIFFTLGSVFTFLSFSVLWGFVAFLQHLMTSHRMPFTALYFGSLVFTLYFSLGLRSTMLTLIGIILQFISLLSFLISYLPGGIAGMKYLASFMTSSVSRSLPV